MQHSQSLLSSVTTLRYNVIVFRYHWPLINFIFLPTYEVRRLSSASDVSTSVVHRFRTCTALTNGSVRERRADRRHDTGRLTELVLKQERRQKHQGPQDNLARPRLECINVLHIYWTVGNCRRCDMLAPHVQSLFYFAILTRDFTIFLVNDLIL